MIQTLLISGKRVVMKQECSLTLMVKKNIRQFLKSGMTFIWLQKEEEQIMEIPNGLF